MTEYRTGNHWGVTIVREGTGPLDDTGHRPDAQLVAVITNGDRELAKRICELLNDYGDDVVEPQLEPAPSAAAIAGVMAIVDAPYQAGLDVRLADDDECDCGHAEVCR